MANIQKTIEASFTNDAMSICQGCKHKKTFVVAPSDSATGVTKHVDHCRSEKRKGEAIPHPTCTEIASSGVTCRKFAHKRPRINFLLVFPIKLAL